MITTKPFLSSLLGSVILSWAVPSLPAASPLLITEFMSGNSTVLADETGAFEDWIEIHNRSQQTVNLQGWTLSDDSGNPRKWTFPSTNLTAGGYLIVFASNQDRRQPGAPLHTNFKLTSDGEYLALVEPDGTTVSTEFAPNFPRQVNDVSFGYGARLTATTVISSNSPGRWLVPRDGNLGITWTLPDFNDSTWNQGTNGLGFETSLSEFPGGPFANSLLAWNPVLYLRAGEITGPIASNQGSLGAAADGTYGNGAASTETAPRPPTFAGLETDNRGMSFDGVDDRVEVPNGPGLNPVVFTAGCWARLTGGAGTVRSPLSSRSTEPQQGYSLQAAANNRWTFVLGTGEATTVTTVTGPSVTLSNWVFLVGVYDGAAARLFVNGQSVGSIATAFAPNQNAPLRVGAGANNTSGGFFFPGTVDEAFVLPQALTASQVLQLYRVATNGAPPSIPSFVQEIRTDLRASLFDQGSSVYVRLPFGVANPSDIALLKLRLKYDDGFVAYLNGVELTAANAPATAAWDSSATERHANEQALASQEFEITSGRSVLREGTNVLALHGLNFGSTNRDFLLSAELELTRIGSFSDTPRYFRQPTPGAPNGQGTVDLGPILTEVSFTPSPPSRPLDADPIVVTTRATPALSPIRSVTLSYRVMFGSTNTLPMVDDGQHNDGAAGDGVFGAVIPPDASKPGQLVRFFVTAVDTEGQGSRWPLFDDPQNSDEYLGTVIANPAVTSALPIWEWFARDAANARSRVGARGSVWFNGEYYDNIFIRERGGFTSIGSQKFDFHTGRHVKMNDEVGRVEEANLNSNGGDPSYMRIPLSYQLHRLAGSHAGNSFPILLRANGAADRVALYVEQVDERFLERRGLDPQGALYKFVQRAELTPGFNDVTDGVEKKTRLFEDRSDLKAISDVVKSTNNVTARAAFLLDNLNLPTFINYFAVRAITRNIDAVRKNFLFYRDTRGTREWQIFPWDMDLTWGNTGDLDHEVHPFHGDVAHRWLNPDQWNWVWEALFNDPRTRPLILRRLRSVMDEQLAPVGLLESRVDAWFAPAFPHLGTSVSNEVRALKSNIQTRRNELYSTYSSINPSAGARGIIPPPQPLNAEVRIASWEVTPRSGNQAEEYICLTNPTPYALDLSGWKLSGGIDFTFAPGTVIGATHVLYVSPDTAAFRARTVSPRGGELRLVVGPYQGTLSARGETLYLTDSAGRLMDQVVTAAVPSRAQDFLRISEIMYQPAGTPGDGFNPEEYEYIELSNLSLDQPLDVSGVRFVDGIEFTFPAGAGAQLPPAGRTVIVRNLQAFRARYGASPQVAGQFLGALSNEGERLRLVDSQGEEILDLRYDAAWQRVATGLGFSLVIREEQAPPDTWDSPDQWQTSARPNGSPGLPEPARLLIPPIRINELLARTEKPPALDALELHNPTAATADVAGWWLTDDPASPKKFRIPTPAVIPAGGYQVFSEAAFGVGIHGFAFSADGDEAWLFSADPEGNLTGYAHGFRFATTDSEVSLGRQVTTDGKEHWVPQRDVTLGAGNAGPQVGPIIISELLFAPTPSADPITASSDEFIELKNEGTQPTPLHLAGQLNEPWKLTGGITFTFPIQTVLGALETILVVGFDPTIAKDATAFRTRYGVPDNTRLFGPFEGRLNNSGDSIRLQKPTLLPKGDLRYITTEELSYDTQPPWPVASRGTGLSLQRRSGSLLAAEPTNWLAARPTAGVWDPVEGRAPAIQLQPQGQTANAYEPIEFRVGAEGTPPLRFQWRFNGTALPDATNQLLRIASAQPLQAGRYDVIVHNSAGSTISSSAILNLRLPASILANPESVIARPGSNVTFRVLAYSTSPLQYQWRRNGTTIPDATGDSLRLSNVQSADVGIYTVVIKDAVGQVSSAPAQLSLLIEPAIVQQPVSQSVVSGSSVTLSISVTNTATLPIGFRLRRNNANVPTSIPDVFLVLTQHTAFFTLTGTNAAPPWTNYSITVTNVAKPAGNISSNAVLTYLIDGDRDGLSDDWEAAYFGATNVADPNGDPDGDHFLNWQEQQAGTHPADAQSFLKADLLWVSPGVTLRFHAVSNRTYTVQFSEGLASGRWTKLADIAANPIDREVRVSDAEVSTNRFYRLVTPGQR